MLIDSHVIWWRKQSKQSELTKKKWRWTDREVGTDLPDISILAFLLRVFKSGHTSSIDGRHCGRELIGKKADRIVSRRQEWSNKETRIDQNPKVPIELEKEMEIGSEQGREGGKERSVCRRKSRNWIVGIENRLWMNYDMEWVGDDSVREGVR